VDRDLRRVGLGAAEVPPPPDPGVGGQRSGGDRPARARRALHDRYDPRRSLARAEPGAQHGQAHPDREPVEEGGQRVQRRVQELAVRRDRQAAPAEAEGEQRADAQRLHAPDGASERHLAERDRNQRQGGVERDLDAKRPGERDALEHGTRLVDLQEAVEEHRSVEHLRRDQEPRDSERDPVGRHDPQHAPPGVGAHAQQRLAGRVREHERPVEQEARDQEEERDARAQLRGDGGEELALQRTGKRRDVVADDREGRDRPQRVHEDEAASPVEHQPGR
jgi:hypothetical protein